MIGAFAGLCTVLSTLAFRWNWKMPLSHFQKGIRVNNGLQYESLLILKQHFGSNVIWLNWISIMLVKFCKSSSFEWSVDTLVKWHDPPPKKKKNIYIYTNSSMIRCFILTNMSTLKTGAIRPSFELTTNILYFTEKVYFRFCL